MVKRSLINTDLGTSTKEYAFIDHIKGGTQFGGPNTSATWKSGATWMTVIDADGWSTDSTTTKTRSAGGITVPSSANFSGPYTLDGQGSGRIALANGTWTLESSSGVTQVSNGKYDVVDSGSGWTMQLTYSGSRQTLGVNIDRNDPSGTGAYIRNVRFYRTEDGADLAAGKVFRTAYKQSLADLNPSAIRFMNWTGANAAKNMRFENRTKPNYAQWTASNYNWVASLAYEETTGTNQYSLAAVTGTPASMQHGEIATCRIGNAMVRGGVKTVSAITKANPGVVTATAHGFQTGDKIVHNISSGMTQLHFVPCTITVTDADTYSIGIDTTSFGTFTSGTANQYITLQVGSGNDRVDYPVVFGTGLTPASNFGNTYIAAGDYKTFYFDKTLAAKADTSGNWSYGVWIFDGSGPAPDKGHSGGTPIEVCTALVNELMAMTRSDGGEVGPIDMWVTVPHMALLSMDPDYSAASNFAIGMVDVALNGANGYAGLDSRCKLYVEYSNETWNTAGGFDQASYIARRGYLRWPASGQTDYSSMTALRSMIMVQDILGASQNFPRSRLKFVLAGQGTVGVSGLNTARMDGTSYVLTDPLNAGGVTPISLHDYFAWAAYFVIGGTWESTNLATIVASWVSHAGDPVAQEADCASYVAGFENTGTSGNETVYRYRDVLLPAYASGLVSRGKTTIMYEGGWDRAISGSTDQQNFLTAVKRSTAWAQKLRGFFDAFDSTAGADLPADYIQTNARWGHTSPDSYGNAVGDVEWSGLDNAWLYASLRNRGLKRKSLVVTN